MNPRYLRDDAGNAHSFIKANSSEMREVLEVVDRLFDGSAHVNVPISSKDNYCIKKTSPVGLGVGVEVSLIVGEWHVQLTAGNATEPYYSGYLPTYLLDSDNWSLIVLFAKEKLIQSLIKSDLFVPERMKTG